MYVFPPRWCLLRSVLCVGQSKTAESQCVRSVALCDIVKHVKEVDKSEHEIELHRERNRVYQARKRAKESELETVQRSASKRHGKEERKYD